MQVETLLSQIRDFQDRTEADPLQVVIVSDGSGHVLAPKHSIPGDETVFEFDNPGELAGWLNGRRSGEKGATRG